MNGSAKGYAVTALSDSVCPLDVTLPRLRNQTHRPPRCDRRSLPLASPPHESSGLTREPPLEVTACEPSRLCSLTELYVHGFHTARAQGWARSTDEFWSRQEGCLLDFGVPQAVSGRVQMVEAPFWSGFRLLKSVLNTEVGFRRSLVQEHFGSAAGSRAECGRYHNQDDVSGSTSRLALCC